MRDEAAIEDRIERAIDALDLPTKVRLLTGASMFALHGEPSIGLQPMVFSDGPNGVRGSEFVGGPQVALLPNATLLAQSWDETAAQRAGELLAGEALAQGVHVVLAPTVNLHRTPLNGRLFECYAEDPLLSGRLAAAYVRGLQRYGVAASVKHWVANESETDRHYVNSQVSEAALRELYLMPFEICIDDAHPWTIMAAYNDVNGSAATEQDELNNVLLKSEWAWDGLLMSDWGATKTAGPAAEGGLDLVMPGPDGPWGPVLVALVEAGEVDEVTIDEHVRRLLRLAGRVGALDGVPAERQAQLDRAPSPTDAVVRDTLRDLASSGMVLLKGQDVLPLDETAITDQAPVVLVGAPARDHHADGRRLGLAAAAARDLHRRRADRGARGQPGPGGRRRRGPAEPAGRRARPAGRPADRQRRGPDRQLRRRRERAGIVRRGGRPDHPRHGRRPAQRRHPPRAVRPADRPDGQPGPGRRTRGRGVDAELRRPDVRGRARPAARLGRGRLHGPADLDHHGCRPRRTTSWSPG